MSHGDCDINSWTSSTPFPRKPKGAADRAWVIRQLQALETFKNYHAHESQVDQLVHFLNAEVKGWSTTFWDLHGKQGQWRTAIAGLVPEDGPPLARAYADQILNFDFAGGVTPESLLPSTKMAGTGAYWEFTRKAIFVSKSLTDPIEILGAVLFECENAKRENLYKASREQYGPQIEEVEGKISESRGTDRMGAWKERYGELQAQKGHATASIEFEVDWANQLKLRAAHGVATQLALCQALGVPAHLLNQEKPYIKGQPLGLPPRTELRGQEARNALWWYWAESWSDREKAKEIWELTNHSELFASSAGIVCRSWEVKGLDSHRRRTLLTPSTC